MVTNAIQILPAIFCTKRYYILCQEIIYTYDQDSNEDFSQTGNITDKSIMFVLLSFSLSVFRSLFNQDQEKFSLRNKVDKCWQEIDFLLNLILPSHTYNNPLSLLVI